MSTQSTPRPDGRVGGIIAVAAAAAFLATFNETFLNVAFTPIMSDFGVDVNTVQWLTTGYLLVAAIFVPVSNVLYHRFPTRPLFIAVIAIMVFGSIIGAVAPSFGVLLIGRLLQAIGTGLLTPIGMNITLAVSPREKLGQNMGIMAAMTTLGPSLAIVLSGVLLTFAPWKALMWIFGLLCLVVLVAAAVVLRNVAELGKPVLDVVSFLLVAVGLIGVLYGVSAAFGGNALYAGIAVLVGVVALVLFVVRQRRIDHPLLDLRPFANTTFVLGVLMTMLGLLFVFAMNVIIPIFLQGAWELPPLGASLTLAPGILLTVVMGPIAGRMFDRFGGKWSIPLGFLAMAVFVSLVAVSAGYNSVLVFGALYVPAVLATSFVIGPSQTLALSSLDRETSPHGVTIVSTSFQIAGSIGTSLAAGIYGLITSRAAAGGEGSDAAQLAGFRGATIMVVIASVIGIILAVIAGRQKKQPVVVESAEPGDVSVEKVMMSEVYALNSEHTVLEALQYFDEKGISGAPITNTDGTLAGFLSDGDVMRYLSATHPSSVSIYSFAAGSDDDLEQAMSDLSSLNVLTIATRDVLTIDLDASMEHAVAVLSDGHIKKVPVVAGDDKQVVGILSRSAINRLAISNYLRITEEVTV